MALKLFTSLLVFMTAGSAVLVQAVPSVAPLVQKNDISIAWSSMSVVPATTMVIDTSQPFPKIDATVTFNTLSFAIDVGFWRTMSNEPAETCEEQSQMINQPAFEGCMRDLGDYMFYSEMARAERLDSMDVQYFKLVAQQFKDNEAAPEYTGNFMFGYNNTLIGEFMQEHCFGFAQFMVSKLKTACLTDRFVTVQPPEYEDYVYHVNNPVVPGTTFATTHSVSTQLGFTSSCQVNGVASLSMSGPRCCLVYYDDASSEVKTYLKVVSTAFCDSSSRSNSIYHGAPIRTRNLFVSPATTDAAGKHMSSGLSLGVYNKCKQFSGGGITVSVASVSGCGEVPTVSLSIDVSYPTQSFEVHPGTTNEVCTGDCETTLLQFMRDTQLASIEDALWTKISTWSFTSFEIPADTTIPNDWTSCPEKTPRGISARVDVKTLVGYGEPYSFLNSYASEARKTNPFLVSGLAAREDGDYTMFVSLPAGSDGQIRTVPATFRTVAAEKPTFFKLYSAGSKYMNGGIMPFADGEVSYLNATVMCI